VQIKQTAVSYPGVGRFRRAETGILGRAIKGVPLGLPFLFAHWYSRPALSAVNLASAVEKSWRDAGVTEWHAREICCAVCSDLAFATLEETPRRTQQFVRAEHSLPSRRRLAGSFDPGWHDATNQLLGGPQWSAALVAGHLDVVECGEDLCDCGKFVALDDPLREEFAIAICDEHAAADESARCERVLA